MNKAQQEGLKYDPFAHDEQTLQAITSFGVESAGEKHQQFLASFARTYGVDYCPVYSVIGSIISQEVIKIAESKPCVMQTKQSRASTGWCSTARRATETS